MRFFISKKRRPPEWVVSRNCVCKQCVIKWLLLCSSWTQVPRCCAKSDIENSGFWEPNFYRCQPSVLFLAVKKILHEHQNVVTNLKIWNLLAVPLSAVPLLFSLNWAFIFLEGNTGDKKRDINANIVPHSNPELNEPTFQPDHEDLAGNSVKQIEDTSCKKVLDAVNKKPQRISQEKPSSSHKSELQSTSSTVNHRNPSPKKDEKLCGTVLNDVEPSQEPDTKSRPDSVTTTTTVAAAALLSNPVEVSQVLTGRVLIKDLVAYIVDKNRHLDVSKWEVLSILRLLLSTTPNQTFDSFRDVESLVSIIEREVALNRDFRATIENLSSGFNSLNSISNGSFKVNAVPDKSTPYSYGNSSEYLDYSRFCNGAEPSKDSETEKEFNWNSYMFANVTQNHAFSKETAHFEISQKIAGSVTEVANTNFVNFMNTSAKLSGDYKPWEISSASKTMPTKSTDNSTTSTSNLSSRQSSNVSRNNSESSSVSGNKSLSNTFARHFSTGCQNPPPGFDFSVNPQRDCFNSTVTMSSTETATTKKTPVTTKVSGSTGAKDTSRTSQKLKVNLKDSTDASMGKKSLSKDLNLDMLPVLQRRISEGKVNCVQCQNGLISGTGKLEALACGHVMHKSCVKNNTLGCPTHCSAIKKTTSNERDVDCDDGDWCKVLHRRKKRGEKTVTEENEPLSKTEKNKKKREKKKLSKSLSAGDKKTADSKEGNCTTSQGEASRTEASIGNRFGSEESIDTFASNSLGTSNSISNACMGKTQPRKTTKNSAWKEIDVPTTFQTFDGADCPICFHSLSYGIAMELVCKHIFHSHCLHKWYSIQGKSCPLCRKVAMTPNEYPALN